MDRWIDGRDRSGARCGGDDVRDEEGGTNERWESTYLRTQVGMYIPYLPLHVPTYLHITS
jgi:hypothetical protein